MVLTMVMEPLEEEDKVQAFTNYATVAKFCLYMKSFSFMRSAQVFLAPMFPTLLLFQ